VKPSTKKSPGVPVPSGEPPTLDQRVDLLESRSGVGVHGTIIQRILIDTALLPQKGLEPLHDRQSHLVWTLGIGGLLDPKMWVYGHTIEESIQKAEYLLKTSYPRGPQ
jgi:hypothetical protein